MTQPTPPRIRAWTVVIAALGVNLILGSLYAWSVMGKALAGQWHWTKTQAMLPFAASTASFAITMIFAGRWQDKIGPRYVAMLGGIIFGLGLVLSSFVQTYVPMVITFGLIGGTGIGLAYSATTPPSIKWFPPARKGLITGIVVSGVGLAAVYMSPLTNYLLKVISIPQTFLILGLGTIVLIALLAQALTNGALFTAFGVAGVTGSVLGGRVRSAGLLIIGNITLIAQDQVPKWDRAFLLVMVVAIFNTCGRFLSGFVSDRIGRTNTMILAFVLQAINMFLFVQYKTPALLLFGSAFTGLCYGTIFTLFPATTADYYGVKNLGVNYGLVFTGFGVAGVIGPMLGGKIRDAFGNYHNAFTIS
ncbi:MAG: OFA family MFS transporter, partial [Verrucomicrobia bacterium]|nr:OFA family MFS transporter [Verrucomicrobiota bacterium]